MPIMLSAHIASIIFSIFSPLFLPALKTAFHARQTFFSAEKGKSFSGFSMLA
jgi:hypothetical protein